jgi:GAF domain-containing protein
MDPLPEVRAALAELAGTADGDADPTAQLGAVAATAQALIPSCVGVSLTLVLDGEAFTLTATSADAAVLDAAQYLQGGPCLAAAAEDHEVDLDDILDERRWQLFRQAAALAGVRSSLSLPVRDAVGMPVGALNLYASDPAAFHGRERMMAEAFGAHTSELVKNADLTFRTREWSRELPEQLLARQRVEQAVGVLVQLHGWPPERARDRLVAAAGKAGARLERVAEVVLSLTAA